MAQEQLAPEFPDRTIAIVDSMTATAGYALLMDELARQRSAGVGFSELCEQANMLRAQVHLWFESYSKCISFSDINYQLAGADDKTAIFENWCDFLNYFGTERRSGNERDAQSYECACRHET